MPRLSGPRMKSGAYYSKGKKRGRKPSTRPKRVRKTVRPPPKMIKNIVKKTVTNLAETKYFQTTRLSALTRLAPISSRSLATPINVLAFAVGTGVSPAAGTDDIIDYGFEPGVGNPDIYALNMVRTFGRNTSDVSLRKNQVEGAYVSPSMCRSEWLIEFPRVDTSSSVNDLLGANPMYMRVIRVKPRNRKYADVAVNPKGDLFVDQYGEDIGVNIGSFNQLELQMYKINSRKYEVIQDIHKILVPTSTTSTFAIANGNTQVTNLYAYGNQCRLVFNHKQPKKLYYTDVDSTGVVSDQAQPDAGQSTEMIFFHFTTLGTEGNVNASNNMEVSCKTVSTFKDI